MKDLGIVERLDGFQVFTNMNNDAISMSLTLTFSLLQLKLVYILLQILRNNNFLNQFFNIFIFKTSALHSTVRGRTQQANDELSLLSVAAAYAALYSCHVHHAIPSYFNSGFLFQLQTVAPGNLVLIFLFKDLCGNAVCAL